MENSSRFKLGHKESFDTKLKRIESMRKRWVNRGDYLGEIKKSPLYNCWRSFMFSNKGKTAGHAPEWSDYKVFYADMIDGYSKKMRLARIDKNGVFSKENCLWLSNEQLAQTKPGNILLEYGGEVNTLKGWSIVLDMPLSAIRQRYYRGKGYSTKEVLFGKVKQSKKDLLNASELSARSLRAKASKMCAQYKMKDKRRGYESNVDAQWMIDHIFTKECVYCGTDKHVGCDRIDNKKGHTIDNIVPACYRCNSARGANFSFKEMIAIGEVIKRIDKERL